MSNTFGFAIPEFLDIPLWNMKRNIYNGKLHDILAKNNHVEENSKAHVCFTTLVKYSLPELCHRNSAWNFEIFWVWTCRFIDYNARFGVWILSNFSSDAKEIFICKI